jgi:hypothetical protein
MVFKIQFLTLRENPCLDYQPINDFKELRTVNSQNHAKNINAVCVKKIRSPWM